MIDRKNVLLFVVVPFAVAVLALLALFLFEPFDEFKSFGHDDAPPWAPR